jgi:hypothetical protein
VNELERADLENRLHQAAETLSRFIGLTHGEFTIGIRDGHVVDFQTNHKKRVTRRTA